MECGPHKCALAPDAIAYIQKEARTKEQQGFARIFKWSDLKGRLQKIERFVVYWTYPSL